MKQIMRYQFRCPACGEEARIEERVERTSSRARRVDTIVLGSGTDDRPMVRVQYSHEVEMGREGPAKYVCERCGEVVPTEGWGGVDGRPEERLLTYLCARQQVVPAALRDDDDDDDDGVFMGISGDGPE